MDCAIPFLANGPAAVYPQTATVLDSDFTPPDPQPSGNPGTTERDSSVRRMLSAKMSVELIHSIIQTHKHSKEAGDHLELDRLLNSTEKQLDQVISANELLLSQPLVETHVNPKRKIFRSPDEEPAPCPQDAKRPRKTSTGRVPVPKKSSKDMPRAKPYGCPGGANACQAHKNRKWTSQLKFVQHFEDYHSEEFVGSGGPSNGTKFSICCDCESNQSLPTDAEVQKRRCLRELAKHIYNNHLSRTKSMHHHTDAVEANGRPGEPADTPHTNSGSTELKHQLHITATPGMDDAKPVEPSGTRYEQTSHAETDNS